MKKKHITATTLLKKDSKIFIIIAEDYSFFENKNEKDRKLKRDKLKINFC